MGKKKRRKNNDDIAASVKRLEKLAQELTDDELDFVSKQISKEFGLDFSIGFKDIPNSRVVVKMPEKGNSEESET